MNEKQKYEQIITGKLEALPLPDMADAIWNRIERQLDLELPTDGEPPAPRSPLGGGFMGGLALLVLTAFLTYFLLRKQPQPDAPDNSPLPVPATNVAEPSPPEDRPLPSRTAAPFVQKRRDSLQAPLPAQDNVVILPPDNQNDSAVRNVVPSLVPSPPPLSRASDSVKKPRGVPGLSDSDYRIVPKKDSTP